MNFRLGPDEHIVVGRPGRERRSDTGRDLAGETRIVWRKLQIVGVLLTRAGVLVVDHPFLGLDVATRVNP